MDRGTANKPNADYLRPNRSGITYIRSRETIMSGECDICGEHTLDCKCPKHGIEPTGDTLTIYAGDSDKPPPTYVLATQTPSNCIFCGEDSNERMAFWGKSGYFQYLKEDETACIECYIDKCVKESMHNYSCVKESMHNYSETFFHELSKVESMMDNNAKFNDVMEQIVKVMRIFVEDVRK